MYITIQSSLTGLKYKDTSTLPGHKWPGYYQLSLRDNSNVTFQTASKEAGLRRVCGAVTAAGVTVEIQPGGSSSGKGQAEQQCPAMDD
jgi:hypothetical protein